MGDATVPLSPISRKKLGKEGLDFQLTGKKVFIREVRAKG
jgi:hypothetical protein